jgi:hypothetical protein
MEYECACGCGKLIEGKKRPREKRYYSPACRQRASRARNKGKHDRQRIMQAAFEREWNAIEQNVYRETWQDSLAYYKGLVAKRDIDIKELEWERDAANLKAAITEEQIKFLKMDLADKEAEIVRLSILLDQSSKKRR